jgi:hypothetical protein
MINTHKPFSGRNWALKRDRRIAYGVGSDSRSSLTDPLDTPLRRALPEAQARAAFLNSTRSEMYTCLELYYSHVKGVVSLMLGLVTGIAAVVGLVSHVNGSNSTELVTISKIGAASVLMLMPPFAVISSIILARYYRLYVAALLFAADLHRGEGISGHSWLDEIEKYRIRLGPRGADNELVIRKRTYSWPHTWSLYTALLFLIALAGFAFGIIIITTI